MPTRTRFSSGFSLPARSVTNLRRWLDGHQLMAAEFAGLLKTGALVRLGLADRFGASAYAVNPLIAREFSERFPGP